MNFWWVNHKQTFRQEFFGKYIWSPKRKQRMTNSIRSLKLCAKSRQVTSFILLPMERFKVLEWRGHIVIHRLVLMSLGTSAKHGMKWVGEWILIFNVSPSQFCRRGTCTSSRRRCLNVIHQFAPMATVTKVFTLLKFLNQWRWSLRNWHRRNFWELFKGIQLSDDAPDTLPLPELRGIVEWEERENACRFLKDKSNFPKRKKQALIKAATWAEVNFVRTFCAIEHFCRVTQALIGLNI